MKPLYNIRMKARIGILVGAALVAAGVSFAEQDYAPNTKLPAKITEAFAGWGRRAELIRQFRERSPNGPYSFQLWGARPIW